MHSNIFEGFVSLVGAGPGDPELLTIKALKAIERAGAVVYDRLVSDGILALIPHGVPRFFAGKSCQQKAMSQEEINVLLVSLARSGQRVVRLKGGDPFLFGRGGEEALALAKAHISFEIIPGITSAQGCAAYAGIPLTHRGLASGVRFITGHRMAEEDALQLDWPTLATPDTTLVIYMGIGNLSFIVNKLSEHGLPLTTPAAVIERGTTSEHRQLFSTMAELPDAIKRGQFSAPSLIIIGRVAALGTELQWFHPQCGELQPISTNSAKTFI